MIAASIRTVICQGAASLRRSSSTIDRASLPLRTRPFASSLGMLAPSRLAAFSTGAGVENCSCSTVNELTSVAKSHAYLDVRTPQEFAAGHAPGAVNIPVMFKGPAGFIPNPEFISTVQAQFPDATVDLCVGCLSGGRSKMAADVMAAAGYTSLLNVEGGYQAWVSAGLPVTE